LEGRLDGWQQGTDAIWRYSHIDVPLEAAVGEADSVDGDDGKVQNREHLLEDLFPWHIDIQVHLQGWTDMRGL
jgi:hypothetical protein